MTNRSNSDPTIQASRRRQDTSSGPEGRAEMPGRGSGGGPSRPSGGTRTKAISGGVAILLLICYGLYSLIFGEPSDEQQDGETASQPTAAEALPADAEKPAPTKKPAATRPASSSKSGQTWTVLLYEDADDEILEEDMFLDLNEAERVGSSDRVQIVAQVDRYKGAFKGDGNWTSTRRYHITQDDNLKALNSELVEDLGEQNMADGATLAEFISWAVKTYPADRYALILSDHGMG